MASQSSSSTGSKNSIMSTSGRSRTESPRRGPANPQASEGRRSNAGSPSDKKHKSMAEVRATGRQSDQGGSPGRRSTRRSSQ